MNDDQLLRYSRQIMLPNIDIVGQKKLLSSKVLVIGLGGLGSPAAMYLTTAGIGEIIIADADEVELSNLQRQILHSSNDIGRHKTASAVDSLNSLNPEPTITPVTAKLSGKNLNEQIAKVDVVLDCSDNFKTRFEVNAACIKNKKPLISGAAIRMEGQVSVFRADLNSGPCYRCLYTDEQELGESCSETGILAPVVGIIGCIQATEALKLLLGLGESLNGRLLLLDASIMEWRTLKLKKDPNCPVCA